MINRSDDLEERLTVIVEKYQMPLLRLCFSYLHDAEMAKDAVQETFIKAYRGLSAFKGDSSEQTWLFRIAINTCKDMLRSSWFRHVDRKVSLDMLPEPSSGTSVRDIDLTIAILELPLKLREAVMLCWYQGMKYSEAAGILGISIQAVSSRLERARKRLRASVPTNGFQPMAGPTVLTTSSNGSYISTEHPRTAVIYHGRATAQRICPSSMYASCPAR